jgi:LETM1 and EF-hand domain-containing protein 1
MLLAMSVIVSKRLLRTSPRVFFYAIRCVSSSADVRKTTAGQLKYYYNKFKDGTVHSWHWFKNGSVLFRKNFTISRELLKKKVKGDELTFREHQLLVKTTADVLKLIPFSFFIIVPFAELLLPVVLKVWPQMLPSTFDAKKLFPQSTTDRSRRLMAKQEMLKFFSEISIKHDMDMMSQKAAEEKQKTLEEFKQLLNRPRLVGQPLPSVDELSKFSSLFQSEFKLDNMPVKHLESICYLLGVDPYPFRSHVILQLKRYIAGVKREDRNISWEGLDSLSREELVEANRRRGMPHEDGRSVDILKKQLRDWIQVSSNRSIPISLLLWSRAFFVTENPELLEIEHKITDRSSSSSLGDHSSETSRIRHMSEDVLLRIAQLEKLEKEVHDATEQEKQQEDAIEKQLEQQILLIEQKSELVKSQLKYLKQIKRLKRNPKIDSELKKIQKGFSVENRRIDSLIKKILSENAE